MPRFGNQKTSAVDAQGAPSTPPAMSPPRWSGRKTAVVAALATGFTSAGTIGAAAALPQGTGASMGGRSAHHGPMGPGGPQGQVGPGGPQGQMSNGGPQGQMGPGGPQGQMSNGGPQGQVGPGGGTSSGASTDQQGAAPRIGQS